MPKERNYNPVQAQRKAEKAKAIKKGTCVVKNLFAISVMFQVHQYLSIFQRTEIKLTS